MAEPVPRYLPTYLEQDSLRVALGKALGQVQGEQLLDVGCGKRPYASLFPAGMHYIGIDLPSPQNVEQCEPDVWASALRLPFASQGFDAVLCTQVLEHVPHPELLIQEAFRVLRAGGTFILTAPQTWGLHEEPHDYYRFTRYGLGHLLESAGFEVERIDARGGAFRVIGQTLLNFLHIRSRIHRLSWWRKQTNTMLNTLFAYLDRRWLWEKDTLGYIALATRPG
jgi:SAM-dependent methyltransferase